MLNYYNYEIQKFNCNKCGWNGPGADLSMGETFNYGFEYHCPKCKERFPGLIPFPTDAEVMDSGSDADKKQVSLINKFQENYQASLLKNISQLPDLPQDQLTFVLREEWPEDEASDEKYIVITERDRIIWKEMLAFEYYVRFIELGTFLKKKYGNAMIDLVPDVNGTYLYGDRVNSIQMVKRFRDSLSSDEKL